MQNKNMLVVLFALFGMVFFDVSYAENADVFLEEEVVENIDEQANVENVAAAAIENYDVEGSLFQQITTLEQEKILMQYILDNCVEKDTCLLSPIDIIHSFEPKYSIKQIELQSYIDGLVQENYISVVNTDKNGELIYCITILPKGKSFVREQKNIKKNWTASLIKTVILAVVSFVIGIILKAIFS